VRTLSSSVTSVAMNRARSPSSPATFLPRSLSTSATTTDPPCSTTILAVAAPSPDPPPVTSTVLPASSMPAPQPEASSQAGRLPGFHLRLQPMLGRWGSGTGWPSRTRSRASRSRAPVTGRPLRGVLSSKAPR